MGDVITKYKTFFTALCERARSPSPQYRRQMDSFLKQKLLRERDLKVRRIMGRRCS